MLSMRSLLLPPILLLAIFQCATAANHHCTNGATNLIELDDFYHKDETLVPELQNKEKQSHMTCSWEVHLSLDKRNLQLVLVGLPATVSDGRGEISDGGAHMNLTSPEFSTEVDKGMFHVMPALKGTKLSVRISWDPKVQSRHPVNLRIVIPVPGFCSRDMLSFHGNCYAFSPIAAGVQQSIENCEGDVQLASFGSMTQINELIDTNNAKLTEIPHRRPLDLTQAVRVGLFYRAIDGAVVMVIRNGRRCQLRSVERPQDMLTAAVKGPCGSIRVDESGRAVLEFVDCDKPMTALLTFPEQANGSHLPSSCGHDLINQVNGLKVEFDAEKTTSTESGVTSSSTSTALVIATLPSGVIATIVIIVGAAVVIAVVIALVIVAVFMRQALIKCFRPDSSTRGNQQCQRMGPAVPELPRDKSDCPLMAEDSNAFIGLLKSVDGGSHA